jgi:hypothetical protein
MSTPAPTVEEPASSGPPVVPAAAALVAGFVVARIVRRIRGVH